MKKRILVIDDDQSILDVLEEMLHLNYEVRTVGRGDKIFEEINNFRPELILMDVMLAGMDGRNICKAIKGEDSYKNLPVILISANVNAYNVMFEEPSPNDFLPKPFDMDDLLNRIALQLAA